MASIFDDLSDEESEFEEYGDSILEGFRGIGPLGVEYEEESEDDNFYSSCDEEECALGPDVRDPSEYNFEDAEDNSLLFDPILARNIPSPTPVPSTAQSPLISVSSLPLRTVSRILPPGVTLQAVEALISTESLASTLSKGRKQNSVGARICALCLRDNGVAMKIVFEKTGVSESSISKLRKKAIERGWKSGEIVQVEHVDDKPRSGRPPIPQNMVDLILATVTKNSTTRGWSCARIAQEIYSSPGVTSTTAPSASTVYRTLKAQGFGVYKRTVKPGLNAKQKEARLAWCLVYEHWTLEDWKDVIFTDETSVQKGGIRGRRRVWRTKEEAHHNHVIARRWKGFSEFMWWSAFSYDQKGPYHIWEKETKEQKATCKADIEGRNAAIYLVEKSKWETAYLTKHRITRRSKPVPEFKHTPKTGLIEVKKGRGGINWYRYQEIILRPKLLPFAKKCLQLRPKTQVQEDNAPAHASKYQEAVFNAWGIQKLLWPGNSPDLNAIEPCWFWMKRETTKKGAITSEKELKLAWIKCWEDMPQERIQAWVERIPVHIEKIIKLKGGNEYAEGRLKGEERIRIYL